MTDQKRENQHYTNQQMLYIHSVHGNAHQDVVEMIGNLCKQRDELREAASHCLAVHEDLACSCNGCQELRKVLTKTKESDDNIIPDPKTIWQKIKFWFLMRRIRKNGAWITWRHK